MHRPIQVLVVGYGSIGKRHASLLQKMGHQVSLVTNQKIGEYRSFADLSDAFAILDPSYIVISNNTGSHASTLKELAEIDYDGLVLIEKPLATDLEILEIPAKAQCYVGYNLRFHPVLTRLKELISSRVLYSTHIYAGSWLPSWRPERDYRECRSSVDAKEGGVLSELSHELDFLCWLTGQWIKVSASVAKVSDLEIESEDTVGLLLQTTNCPVTTLQLNYTDRLGAREIIVNADNLSIRADLVSSVIKTGQGEERFQVERNDSYLEMHQELISGNCDRVCSLDEAIDVLKLITGARQSASCGKTIFYDQVSKSG